MQQGITIAGVPLSLPTVPTATAAAPGGGATLPGAFQALLLDALGAAPASVPTGVGPQPEVGVAGQPLPQVALPVNPTPAAAPEQPGVAQVPAGVAEALLGQVKDPGLGLLLKLRTAAAPESEPESAQPEQEQPGDAAGQSMMQATLLSMTLPASPTAMNASVPEQAPPSASSGAEVPNLTDGTSDPMLEAFVARAAEQVTGKAAESAPVTDQEQPTFQDLVKLISQPESEQQPAAEAAHQKVRAVPAEPVPTGFGQPKAVATLPQPTPATTESEPRVDELPAPGAPAVQVPEAASAPQEAEAAHAPRTLDPEPVVRQVSRFMKVALDGGHSEVRFHLHPQELGSVAVKLVLSEGVLRADLTTQDAAVKAVLETNLDQLRTRLADQGLRVEHLEVAVGSDGRFGQSHQDGRQGQGHGHRPSPRSHQWGLADEGDGLPGADAAPAVDRWAPRSRGARLNRLA